MLLKKLTQAVLSESYTHLHITRRILPSRLFSTTNNEDEYDVVIAGGGMVGGAMACALGNSSYMSNKRVLLVDAGPRPEFSILSQPPAAYNPRVCAISPGNVEFLKTLGAWKNVPRSAPVKRMQVWDACSDALIAFEQNGMEDDLCYIVENDMITSSLMNTLETDYQEKVNIRRNTKIVACDVPKSYGQEDGRKPIPLSQLSLSDGSTLSTKLLIASDGANSFIASSVNLPKLNWNYDQTAVIANLILHEPSSNIVAWQRFLPSGPIALLPLDDVTSSLVWSTSHSHAQQLLDMSEEEFVSEINNAFWQESNQSDVIRSVQSVTKSLLKLFDSIHTSDPVMQYPASVAEVQGRRYKFPLGCSHATQYVKPRLAFVGDAIHRIHPLAGQGVNLGFRDVESLSQILDKAVYEGRELGSLSTLLSYESERQAQNVAFVAATDVFKRLFSTDLTPVVALRSIGLMAFNQSTMIKDAFMAEAAR